MRKLIRCIVNIGLFVAILYIDRLTKHLASIGALDTFRLPFVSCNVAMNRGISWGWFHTDNTQQFIFISFIIAFIILLLTIQIYLRWKKNQIIWPYVLVLSGAISNMVDRITYKGVIDFIEVSCYGWTWPVFNIADMSIVIGICCIVLQELRK